MRKEERKKEKSPLVIFVVVASKAPQCSGFDCKESPKNKSGTARRVLFHQKIIKPKSITLKQD